MNIADLRLGTFVVYLTANMGLAFSDNFVALMVLNPA